MKARLALALAVAVLGVLVTPAFASAHYVSVFPRYGTFGDNYRFTGTHWQPFKRVRWLYDESFDGDFDDTGRFFTNRYGSFRFTWRGENVVDTHRMCFRQFDSRRGIQRYVFRCRRFTLLPD
jgi:hypothetical protein